MTLSPTERARRQADLRELELPPGLEEVGRLAYVRGRELELFLRDLAAVVSSSLDELGARLVHLATRPDTRHPKE